MTKSGRDVKEDMTADREVRRSFCRSCSGACGMTVEIAADQVVRVRGDVNDPLSQGYLCGNGRAIADAHHHPDRLERPMMRSGDRLVESSWDRCLDDLAGRLKTIIDESGPDAVGIFRGGGCYMDTCGYFASSAIPRALGTRSVYSDMSVDVICKPFVSELMSGVPGQMAQPDFERCRLVVYVGSNPVVSHGHTSMYFNPIVRLRELMTAGAVWVIDPRRTETAALATRHLAPRPGTDYAVFAFAVRELLRDGADHDYLREHAQDVDALSAAVEPFGVERTADVTGLATGELEEFLLAIRRAGRLAIETGTGVSMSAAANVTQWLTWATMIVTASLDRPGGAWINPGFLQQLDKRTLPVSPPGGKRGDGPASRPELRSIVGEFPCVAMPDEIEAGNLRAVLNLGGNLVTCLPGTDRTVAALEKLDVLASLDIMSTETTALSTHVLPTKDQLERADIPYLLDTGCPTLATKYTAAVIPPVGERRAMWWVLGELGRRIGYDFLPGIDLDVAEDDDVLARIAKNAPVSFDELRASGVVQAGEGVSIGWFERHVDHIGGWRLAPVELVEQLSALEPPAPLVLISRRPSKHINSRNRHRAEPPEICANEQDANAAGLVDGDEAIVCSDRGEVRGTLRIDRTLRRGALTIHHGWGHPNVNRLTSVDQNVDALTGMPRLSGVPVSLHPAGVPDRGK